MKNIIRNLAPYWKTVILLVVFLCAQAYCDLALPQYTQDIIDVGIQDKGIEYVLPEKTTAAEYRSAQLFMTKKEKQAWRGAYRRDGRLYRRTVQSPERLAQLDDQLLVPIVLTYQMGHATVSGFRSTVRQALEESRNPAAEMLADRIDEMSVKEIGQLFNVDLKTFRAENEDGRVKTYVDMRPLIQELSDSGSFSSGSLRAAKKKMQAAIDRIGDQTLHAMGVAYAGSCDEKAGMDVDRIQKDYLWHEGRLMAVMALGMMLSGIVVAFFASRTGALVGRDLRRGLYRNVIGYSSAEMDRFSSASLITRSTNDVQQVQLVTTLMLRMVLYAPILGIWSIFKVAQTGAHMGWVIALGVLVIIGIIAVLVKLAMPKFKIMQKLIDAVNRVSREILTGLLVIRAFGREKTEEERFDRANVDLRQTQLFTGRVMSTMMPAMMMVMNGLVVLITWVASHRVNTGDMQVGTMTAFITYAMMIVMSFLMLSMLSIMLPRAGVAADRIAEVLATKSSIRDPQQPRRLQQVRGEIRFEHVRFRYPGAADDALEDIDFTAAPGETTAIIGSTGSGKTTLVNLIPRFYDVTGGTVRLDGIDVRELRLADLRAAIGFVPQKGILFSGTVASNLRFGREDATEEELRQAARTAQAEDFIDDRDGGFESHISQGGANVSGGQKQRLAIARALVRRPPVLVFDDSFSALDMKTDAALRRRLSEEARDTARIIVAQRISTVLHADQILVLHEGRVVGRGRHQDLMRDCEVYRQIARSQLSNTELEGIG
ncbi:MAG: ABC transporter ATP-binding protein [Anaerovoracaceae bacterium]|jgi:ATP-binding cassette subfamily B multidrug efflux pump